MLEAPTGFRIPPPPRLPSVVNYAVAVALPVGGLLVQQALRGWTEPIPFVLFFFTVSLVSSMGGWGPGFLSVVVSALCGWYFLSSSPMPLRAAGAFVGTAMFLPVGALIAGFGALVRAGFREREDAAAQLARAVRTRDAFISMASHELKTPLTALSLAVQQLLRSIPSGEAPAPPVARQLRAVRRQTDRLAGLVERMLDVSRIGSRGIDLSPGEMDLADVARDVAERFGDELALSGTALEVRVDGPVVGVWDRVRVEQVLTNLVSNAAKYGAGLPITISAQRRGSAAVIEVRDRGLGIAPEDQSRVFGRYERGPHGDSPAGFGLGLWIVGEIVAAMDGTVHVDSAVGQGSTFTVVLPSAPRQGTRVTSTATSSVSPPPPT